MFVGWFTINEDLVCAPPKLSIDYSSVNNRERAVTCRLDVGMVSRGTRVIEDHRVIGSASDSANALGHKAVLPLSAACISDLENRHTEDFGARI